MTLAVAQQRVSSVDISCRHLDEALPVKTHVSSSCSVFDKPQCAVRHSPSHSTDLLPSRAWFLSLSALNASVHFHHFWWAFGFRGNIVGGKQGLLVVDRPHPKPLSHASRRAVRVAQDSCATGARGFARALWLPSPRRTRRLRQGMARANEPD